MSGLELFGAAQAWAAGGGAAHHEPSIGEIIYPAINFILYAGVLYYFALPLVRNFLRSRQGEIVAAIDQAAAKKQQAEALVRGARMYVRETTREVFGEATTTGTIFA